MARRLLAAPFLITLLLVLGIALPVPVAGNPPPAARPVFQYSTTATEPVIEYHVVHHMLVQQDPIPLLRVYGNGRVQVHFPVYMKRAGDYEMQLSRARLNDLIRQLADDGILDFDPHAARLERQQLAAARQAASGELFHISDASDTHINVRLTHYQRNLASPRINGFVKQFHWRNLDQDARHYPESSRLSRAAGAATVLRNLCEHPALRKLP